MNKNKSEVNDRYMNECKRAAAAVPLFEVLHGTCQGWQENVARFSLATARSRS
jgi:hypothetical protein